jgi:hypothetical protein
MVLPIHGMAELASMLPGFRFLFAAVLLSMSILVFGLGAAALLRAAHEEFANHPARRAPPEPVFARQNFPANPMLALLRVDPAVAEKPADNPAADAAVPGIAPDIPAPAEKAEATPAETGKLAALKSEEPVLADAAVRPEAPVTEAPVTEALAETPAAPAETEAPVANPEMKLAAIAETPEPPVATTAPPAGPAKDGLSPEDSRVATRIATLGNPVAIVDRKASAKTTNAAPDRSAIKQRVAQRARERRRATARRARLAREAALAARAAEAAQQLQINPFSQEPVARGIP